MKYINKIVLLAFLAVWVSCTDEYDTTISMPEKPEKVSLSEYLNGYDVLKTYIDRSTAPDFKLGGGLASDVFLEKKTDYGVIYTNFDETTPTDNLMMFGSTVDDDGTMDFSSVKSYVMAAQNAGISLFGRALCWHRQQNPTYLNETIKSTPGETFSGKDKVADFESDELGTVYPMSGNSKAEVVMDPASEGKQGKVLHVGDAKPNAASYSYPVIPVKLPEGKKLGDYTKMWLDFNGTGSTGLYGSGMRIGINDAGSVVTFGSPSSFGCGDNQWGDALITFELAGLNLTDAQKELTEFNLVIGSGTGSGDYYIDNIVFYWEYTTEGDIKTPEEKKDTLTKTMDKWMTGLMEAGAGYVKAWDAINEPMSDADPYVLRSSTDADAATDGNFYWQDYLGEDYARTVVRLARQHGGDGVKLFVNEYGLEADGNDKCKGLIQVIEKWESDGTTRFDGIGTQLYLTYSADPVQQAKNEENVVKMFQLLAATGKLVRISALTMNMADTNGSIVNASSATFSQQLLMGEYYNFVIRKYLELVPAAQRYGITLWNPLDSSVGLWNSSYERMASYIGFANGLTGKETENE